MHASWSENWRNTGVKFSVKRNRLYSTKIVVAGKGAPGVPLLVPYAAAASRKERARGARTRGGARCRWTSASIGEGRAAPAWAITPIRSIVGRPIVHWVVGAPMPSLVPRGGAYPAAKFRSSVRVHKREGDSRSPLWRTFFFPVAPSICFFCRSFTGAGTLDRE
jgi:hypothetical protein